MKKLNALMLTSFWALPLISLAVVTSALPPPRGVETFGGFLKIFTLLISWMFTLLMVFAVIFIILAAFHYLTAGGDSEKIATAHKEIIWAVVAIAVGLLAQGVTFIVGELISTGVV